MSWVASHFVAALLGAVGILYWNTAATAQPFDPSSSQFREKLSHALSWEAYWWGSAILSEHQGQPVEWKVLGFEDHYGRQEREKRRILRFEDHGAKIEREDAILAIAPRLRTVIESAYSPGTGLRTIRVNDGGNTRGGDRLGGLFGVSQYGGEEAATWSESVTYNVPNQLLESYRNSISDPSRDDDLARAVLEEHRGDYIDYDCKPTARIPAYSEMDPAIYVLISCGEERWVSMFGKPAAGGWTLRQYPKAILSGTSDFRPVARMMQSHRFIELSLE